MATSTIRAFQRDDEGYWVAELACGHTQHLRHRPPFEVRERVTTSKGRAELVGTPLDCLYCDMPSLPIGLEVYKSTAQFDETTVPKGLLADHTTRAGTWGRIVVGNGRLLYTIGNESWILTPEVPGIVEPTVRHHVTPKGAVSFHVEFLRQPRSAEDS